MAALGARCLGACAAGVATVAGTTAAVERCVPRFSAEHRCAPDSGSSDHFARKAIDDSQEVSRG